MNFVYLKGFRGDAQELLKYWKTRQTVRDLKTFCFYTDKVKG